MKEYDVVIAGAGPAGCTAAIELAGRGFRVLLLDKDVFPREKVCGDGIAPRAVHSLYRMGMRGEMERNFFRTSGIRFFATCGGMTEVRYPMGSRFPDHGYVAPRHKLDHLLLNRAAEAGAEIWEGCRVTGVLSPEKGLYPGVEGLYKGKRVAPRARYVVGAEGSSSVVAGSLGLHKMNPVYVGVSLRCYMEGAEGVEDFLEIYPEDAVSPACGWIFPVGGKTVNVGVGAMLYAIKSRRINLNRTFEAFLKRTRHASARLRKARIIGRVRGALLRVGMGGVVPARANVILAGDAAAMTNPISGEGITYALESGRWAAETLAAALTIDDPRILSRYPRILQWRYADYFRRGTMAIRFGNRPEFVNPLLFLTSRWRGLGDKMGRYLMNCRRHDFPP